MNTPEHASAFSLRPASLVVALLFVVYGALAISYIERTSFEVDGSRVFCLWDDGMISMRYANHLAAGHGFVWNPGESGVQGYTNLGITLVMAAIHLLPIGLATTSLVFQIVNLVALLAIGWLVRRLADELFGAPVGVFALAMTFASAPVAVWALQGSDSGLVSIWLILSVARVCRVCRVGGVMGSRGEAWSTGLLLAIGPILRLDVMIYVVPLLAYIAFSGRARRESLISLGLVFASLGLILGASLLYYGDPLPNTFYLRASGTPLELIIKKGFISISRFGVLWPVLILAFVGLVRGARDPRTWLCATLVAAAFFYNTLVGGDWADPWLSRYATPVLPILFVLGAGAGAAWRKGVETRWAQARTVAALMIFAAVGLYSNPPLAWNEWMGLEEPMYRDRNIEHAIMSGIFERELEASEVIAVHFAGVMPYFREGPALDVLGKTDGHIAHLRVDVFEPGHSKWDWDYVLDKRPEVIVIASRGLHDHPVFRRDYRHAVDRRRPEYSFFARTDVAGRLPSDVYEIRPIVSPTRRRR